MFIKGIRRVDVDMAKLLEEVKSQQKQELAESISNKQQTQPTATQPTTQKRIVQHGDAVELEDGTVGIYIDHQVEMQRLQEVDKTKMKLMNLVKQDSSLITDENQEYVVDEFGNHTDPGTEWLKRNPYSTKANTMRKIKAGFSQLTYGFKGLVPINSEEGRIVAEALDKVRTGEVILPTPEEYEAQRLAAEHRKRERMQRLQQKANEQPTKKQKSTKTRTKKKQVQKVEHPVDISVTTPPEEPETEIKMAEAPKYAIVQKGVLEQLMENNKDEITKSTSTIEPTEPVTIKKPKSRIPVVTTDESISDSEGMVITNTDINSSTNEPSTQVPPPPQQEEKKPLDMFQVHEMVEAQRAEILQQTDSDIESSDNEEGSTATETPDVMHITLEKGQAKDFAQNMPKELYDKFQATKTVHIEEIEMKQIPTATRRITDISQYRELCSKRPNHVVGELAERALVNSGIIIVVKAASSIEQASIFLPHADNYMDYDMERVYEFMYTHTVDTSIGKLSYNEFKDVISLLDIDTVLEAIYSISEQKEKTISMNCPADDEDDGIPGCGGSFEMKINTGTLPDTKNFPKESMDQVKKIIKAKGDLEKSKEIQMTSPASTVRIAKIGDRYFVARSMTASRYITLDARRAELSKYPQIIKLLLINVDSIQIETPIEGTDEVETSVIDSVELIAEELTQLTDEELTLLKQFLTTIKEYVPMRFSIKGPYQCPLCGKVHPDAQLNSMIQLIFQVALTTLS